MFSCFCFRNKLFALNNQELDTSVTNLHDGRWRDVRGVLATAFSSARLNQVGTTCMKVTMFNAQIPTETPPTSLMSLFTCYISREVLVTPPPCATNIQRSIAKLFGQNCVTPPPPPPNNHNKLLYASGAYSFCNSYEKVQ